MIFDEIYSRYYHTVAVLIKKALSDTLDMKQFREVLIESAYKESPVFIENSIVNHEWQIFCSDFSTPIKNAVNRPNSDLERSWLKAISCDPRVRLFTDNIDGLDDVEPLFNIADIIYTDKYKTDDCFTDEKYIKIFRTILYSVQNKKKLKISYPQRDGKISERCYSIKRLEYSEKEDLFRAYTVHPRGHNVLNLCKIIACELMDEDSGIDKLQLKIERSEVRIKIINERNALERALLHFATFEKMTCRANDGSYEMTIKYNTGDANEMLVRILSFGPMAEVVAPERAQYYKAAYNETKNLRRIIGRRFFLMLLSQFFIIIYKKCEVTNYESN